MSERNEARRKVFDTLLMNSVLRWESLVTLVLTLVLFISVGQFVLFGLTIPAFIWLILGGVAEASLVMAMFTDPEETRGAFAKEFERKHKLSDIHNRVSRDRLLKAMEYRHNMLDILSKARSGAMRIRVQDTINQVNDWISAMYNLAIHIDNFGENALLNQDLRSVPAQIEKVKIRIERENNEQIQSDLMRQLELLEQQKLNLEQTRNSVKRAEIQLETTLSSLGTVYAQMSLLGTRGSLDSNRQQRLSDDIQDEVNSLQDTLEAMDEVQSQMMRLR